MFDSKHVYALILAGGGGTRLWPQSRNKTPKQFLKLQGNMTMLQKTAERFAQIVPWDHIFIIGNHEHRSEVGKQLPKIPKVNLIFEPEKKETAMAMLVGALYIGNVDKQAVIINEASDHVVVHEDQYCDILRAAAQVAQNPDYLISVGIKPENPSTAFGYIKVGKEIKNLSQQVKVYSVDSFREKPDQETAAQFVSSGDYYWNANNYVWSVQAISQAFEKYFSELSQLTKPLVGAKQENFEKIMDEIYPKATKISIDYAISEKADNLLLIPADYGWNDIGEWKVVYDLGDKKTEGNVITSDSDETSADPLLIDAKNNLIHTDKRLIALLGVDDMIVVDTQDVVLVAPKSRSQDVKKLVEKLKADGREEYL